MSLSAGGAWTVVRSGLALLAMAAAVGSLLATGVAVLGVRSGRLGWRFAAHDLVGTATPALAAVALAAGLAAVLLAFAVAPRGAPTLATGAALLGAAILAGTGALRAQQARRALFDPPVHDVATDWREPLMPTAALLRRRGVDALPIEAAPALSEGPRGAFLGRLVAEVNAATCPQAEPLVLPAPPTVAYVRLKAAVGRLRLRLVTDDVAAGVLEAQAPAPFAYGGHADVLARVRAQGEGARIDLRSVSRHGEVDGGTNCRRIAALRAAIASG